MKVRITIDAQSFEVEVGDLSARPIPVMVEGDSFLVWPEESVSSSSAVAAAPVARRLPTEPAVQPVRSTPPANGARTAGSITVAAPIPGVIISVAVRVGDSVVFGQELCILEAMKMKNVIRANRAGKIATVCVAAGDQVKHSQVLMEFTD